MIFAADAKVLEFHAYFRATWLDKTTKLIADLRHSGQTVFGIVAPTLFGIMGFQHSEPYPFGKEVHGIGKISGLTCIY